MMSQWLPHRSETRSEHDERHRNLEDLWNAKKNERRRISFLLKHIQVRIFHVLNFVVMICIMSPLTVFYGYGNAFCIFMFQLDTRIYWNKYFSHYRSQRSFRDTADRFFFHSASAPRVARICRRYSFVIWIEHPWAAGVESWLHIRVRESLWRLVAATRRHPLLGSIPENRLCTRSVLSKTFLVFF